MTKEQINHLIRILENVRLRPGMYACGGRSLFTTWIYGFDGGLIVSGIQIKHYNDGSMLQVMKEHGWDTETSSFTAYLENRGLSQEEINQEILTIEIEVWKMFLVGIDDIVENASRREQVNLIIQTLEAVRQNPTQYMYGETDFAPATFLSGLHEGLMLFGAIQDQAHVPLFDQVKRERGWTEDTPDFFHYLKNERGFSDEEATKELLSIEIAAWKRLLAEMEAGEAEE